jgi:Kef-type K+ transport system membrane component KefB
MSLLRRARTAWLGLAIMVAIAHAAAVSADEAGVAAAGSAAGSSAAPAAAITIGVDAGVAAVPVPVDAGTIDARAIDARAIDARGIVDAGVAPADARLASADAGVAFSEPGSGFGNGSGSGNRSGSGSGSGIGVGSGLAAAGTTPVTATSTSANTLFAIKIIGGLVALLVLAYLGGHRRVVRFQERLGLSGVITAGFPFVALGLIASLPSVGILTGDVLARLRPLLHFGLGWLGFIIGAQLDIRVLDRVPKGTAYIILVEALGPFAITAAACGGVMLTFGLSWQNPAVWRDVILLGTAAAMTAPRKFRGFANRTWHEGRNVDILLAQLDELVGVIGLLFITAYFRDPGSSAWQLPNTAWIFISLGLGVAIGVLIFAMIRVPTTDAEFLAVVLGGIAFASGLAGYLHLSPIVVCFLAGVLVTNFPNDQRDSVFRILNHLERPVHLLFLIIAGAVWNVADWRGWVLVPLFVVARVVGKWAGIFAARASVGADLPIGYADQRSLMTPLSSLSIALVISMDGMSKDEGLPWIVTAVIGGAIISELLTQFRPTQLDTAQPHAEDPQPAAPIDELDNTHANDGSFGGDVDSGPVVAIAPRFPTTPPMKRDPTLPAVARTPTKTKPPGGST